MPGHPTVYRFFDDAGDLLYVGSTWQPHLRWVDHQRKSWFLEAATITVEHFDDVEQMKRAEQRAIRTERPRHNIAGCSRSSQDQDESPKEERHTMPDLAQLAALTARRADLADEMERLDQEWRDLVAATMAHHPVADVALTAGISRARVYQIRDGRR